MKIPQLFQSASLPATSQRVKLGPESAEGSPDQFTLSLLQHTQPEPTAPAAGWGKKLARGAFKTALAVGGLAVGALAASGLVSIGTSLGIGGLALGALAQYNDDSKIKLVGALLMLGSFGAVGGAMGEVLSGLKIFAGIMMVGVGAGEGHQLANEILDGRKR